MKELKKGDRVMTPLATDWKIEGTVSRVGRQPGTKHLVWVRWDTFRDMGFPNPKSIESPEIADRLVRVKRR